MDIQAHILNKEQILENLALYHSQIDEQYLVDWCDRLNRSATHRADLARSIISKQKAEMQNRI